VWARQQKWVQAQSALNQALQSNPKLAMAYSWRATTWLATSQAARALQDINSALEIQPQQAQFYLQRAQAAIALKDLTTALKDCTRALQLQPKYTAALQLRADIYRRQGQWSQALADLERWQQVAPDQAQIRLNQGIVYLTLKQPKQAQAAFTQALALDGNALSLYYRGHAHLQQNQAHLAHKDWQQACEQGVQAACALTK
jgi:tetratricopeptide (TPR) repeat protein